MTVRAFQGEVFRFPSTGQHVLCRGEAGQFEGDRRFFWQPLPSGPRFAASCLMAELTDPEDVPGAVKESVLVGRYWGWT